MFNIPVRNAAKIIPTVRLRNVKWSKFVENQTDFKLW